jgi:hypothetical protein
MRKRIRGGLTYSNVMSTLCFFLLLTGGLAYAAGHLGKNTVGTKQLKKNAVTTAKIKKQAVTAAKVKKGTLTGTQINASTLGTVPTAQTANALAPSEGWHEVGAPGEPGFLNSWHNLPAPFESAAFFKDHEGVVHLRGAMTGGTGNPAFLLPPGYRPPAGHGLLVPMVCAGGTCGAPFLGPGAIDGPGVGPGLDGAVQAPAGVATFMINGITFRAES